MNSLIRNILPYGFVMKMAADKKARQKEQMAKERLKDIVSESSPQLLDNQIRINMGCGTNSEKGWINIDGSDSGDIQLFMVEDTILPFEKDSVTAIFSEHFIEHIPLKVGRRFIMESFRVLKKGGIFRVSCPDVDAIAGIVCNKNDDWKKLSRIYESIGDFQPGELFCSAQVINWSFYGHSHCHLYNLEQMQKELENAGFVNIKRMPFGESLMPGAAIEKRKGEAFYSLIVEGQKG